MRRTYTLEQSEANDLKPIMEGIIWRLEAGDVGYIELSYINLGPSQFMDLLDCIGYERLDDWDTNGWEQDTWYYYVKEGHPELCLFYCGYSGSIKLFLREEEE